MADYWVCSECGEECELVEIDRDFETGHSDQRSDCCGAIPEYKEHGEDDRYVDIDLDTWDMDRDIDY